MAELERRAAAPVRARDEQALATQSDIEGLPALVGRLGDDVMRLLDTKLSLVKVELKEEASAYGKGAAGVGAGAVVATVGLVLALVSLAFFVSTFFTFDRQPLNYALGFLITGVLFLAIGGAIALVMKNRLAKINPAPERTLEEFRKDKRWLKNEV
ncbi:MAG TPA: phage holin family protein [Pyrinomonadaceae bacterium]|nr:phage holin family protein [Pyrinomonadaceae bacterium]